MSTASTTCSDSEDVKINAMSPTSLQILEVGATAPVALSGADDWVIEPCPTLAHAAALLAERTFDAVLLHATDEASAQALEHWPALSQAVQDAAVLAVLPHADAQLALRLVQRGVQDVLPVDELVAGALLRCVTLSVARKRLEELQRKGGSIDLATGLPTRQQWLDHLSQLCALREREPAAMAVVVLRVEGLASVQARLSATAANSLQRKIAVRLRSSLRASDLVGALGTDAYAVLLSWLDTPAASERVAEKLVAALQRPYTVAGEQLSVAVSAGLARYAEHGRDAQTLLRVAHAQAASFVALGRTGFANRIERGGVDAANDD
jgi:diguanylate cyclase (GGDEF)-like protein